ncbi:MAG: hypothetical protein JRN59_06700 [Nitrososphaerota archaeon]|nr:hypothetical protein [Nitrososphaerota archaeon]
MNTLTNAYEKKLSSGLVASLLILSAISIIPLVISPVHASNAQFTTSMSYPYSTVGGITVTRGVAVTNPLGNAGITEIDINIPAAAAASVAATAAPTGLAASAVCDTAGTGPWTVECLGSTSGSTILPAGAKATITITFNSESSQSASGAVDSYAFTVTAHYSDSTSQSATNTFYEGTLSTTNVTPSATSFTAGKSITYTVALGAADSGLKLSWFSNPSTAGVAGDGFAASFGTPSFTAGSGTSYTSTFTSTEASATSCTYADNGAIDNSVPCGYFAWVNVGTPSSHDSGGLITPSYAGSNTPVADALTDTPVAVTNAVAVISAAPTQVTVGIAAYDNAGHTPDYITNGPTAEPLTVTLADSYGNAVVTNGITGTAKISALKGTIANPSPTISCDGSTCTLSVTPTYAPVTPSCTSNCLLPFGTFDLITASLSVTAPAAITGTYAGSSAQLSMSYDTTATIPTPTWTVYEPSLTATSAATGTTGTSNVVAGSKVQLSVTLNGGSTVQANVPVNFTLTSTSTSVPYAGTFSNGLSWIVVHTNSLGIAAANFTSDTTKGDAATAVAIVSAPESQPTYSASNTLTSTAATGAITTTPAAGTQLQVLSFSSSTFTVGTTSPQTYVKPSGHLYLDVLLQDAYGNSVTWPTANGALQISVSASSGGLSATTVYITAGSGDTHSSGYTIQFTAPVTLGSLTIAASTTQTGINSGSETIHVVSPDPTVLLTPTSATEPASTTLVSNTATVNATGVPSKAATTGTVVTTFEYSLNGAANQTVGVTSTNSSGVSFTSFPVTFLNGTNTLKIYATDSNNNVGVGTFTFTVTHAPVSPTLFTSPGAKSATSAGFTGVNATFTNTGSSSETANVYFVWYNSANQVVSVGAQLNVVFAAHGSASFFNSYQVSGHYTVKVFVQDTVGNALSTSYSAPVTIS